MSGIPSNTFNRRRGTILMTSMAMIMLIAFGTVMLARMVIDQQRLDIRRRGLSRAFYAAQAGVSLVQHWSNYPQDYTINPTLFVMGNTSPGFDNLRAALGTAGFTVSQTMLTTMNEGVFRSKYNYDVGKLTTLELLPHVVGDPVNCLFKVKSTGRSANGLTRTITSYLDINVAYIPPIPAGLISYNAASMGGNAKVHWGEAWSKGNFTMLNKSQMDYLTGDAWAKWRTEGVISFPNNWNDGADYDDSPPTQQPGLGSYLNLFYHRLPAGTLQWPVFDYYNFKDMALSHGRYYGTDSSGNIYRNGIKDAAHRVGDFLTEFGIANRDAEPYRLYFIDTTNGQPPAADGSNLATVHVSGNGLGLKGVLWMGINFDGSGIGNPPLITDAKDPDATVHTLSQIFLEGVIYAAGTVAMSGNCGVYGSVIAQKGYVGGGTPDIYYNKELSEGLLVDNGNTGSRFKVVLQKN